MYSNPLYLIRQYLAGAMGDNLYGQCGTTGATTSKIYAPFLYKADDYYNNNQYEVYVYAGTNIGVTKRITDWVLSTFLATVHSVYTAACDASSWIELHRIFTEDDYRKAINLAIDSIADGKYLIDKIDATITLVADKYEYTLPTDLYNIGKITTEKTADTGTFDDSDIIDPRTWRLISSRKLKLHEDHYSITAGKDLRIEGQGRQAIVTSDADLIKLPTDWLVQKAITFLPMSKIESNKLDSTYRQVLALSAREPVNSPDPTSRRVIE